MPIYIEKRREALVFIEREWEILMEQVVVVANGQKKRTVKGPLGKKEKKRYQGL